MRKNIEQILKYKENVQNEKEEHDNCFILVRLRPIHPFEINILEAGLQI